MIPRKEMEVRPALPERTAGSNPQLENARNRLGNIRTITITATTLTYLVANTEGEMFMLYS